ncbi:hypothetical protein FACS1894133_2190 [Clostridia bacterium]|nr:hypothetical protein FACS1894133_2190 [Clostridia bacterium]
MLKIRTKLSCFAVAFAVAITATASTMVTANAEAALSSFLVRSWEMPKFASGTSSFIVDASVVRDTDSGYSRSYGGNPGDLRFVWGYIQDAKCAVYYTCVDNATGKVSDWTVKAVGEPELRAAAISASSGYRLQPGIIVANPVKNATYYFTVLTYTDTPTRQYGGFSGYGIVRT